MKVLLTAMDVRLCLAYFIVGVAMAMPASQVEKRILLEDSYDTIIGKLDNLTAEVNKLKAAQVKPVAFQAFLTQTVSGSQSQILIFDDVALNIGDGYKVLHGNFLAPVAGTYLFTVHACSGNSHADVLDLNVNGNSVGRVLAGSESFHACNTGTWVTHLSVGDDVYVSAGTYGDLVYVNPTYGRPNFLGVLISA